MEKLRRNRVNLALDKLRTLLPYATIIKKDMASLLEQTVEYINIMHKHCNRHSGDHLQRIYLDFQHRIQELEEKKKEMKRSFIKKGKSNADAETDSEDPLPKVSRYDQQLQSSSSKNKDEDKSAIKKLAKHVIYPLQNGSDEKKNQLNYQPAVVPNSDDSQTQQNVVNMNNVYNKSCPDLQNFSINEPPKDKEACFVNWNMYQQPVYTNQQPQQQYYTAPQRFAQSGHQQPDSKMDYQPNFEKYAFAGYDSKDFENKEIEQDKQLDDVGSSVLLMNSSPQSNICYTSLPSVSNMLGDSVDYGYSTKTLMSTLTNSEVTQSTWHSEILTNNQSSDEILPSVGDLHFGAEEALNPSLTDENARYVIELIGRDNSSQDE